MNLNVKFYFGLFPSVILVRGALNHVLYDLHRHKIYKVDFITSDFLTSEYCTSEDEKFKNMSNEEQILFKDVLIRLVKEELIWMSNHLLPFKKMEFNSEKSSIIDNVIIEYSENLNLHLDSLIKEFNTLGVKYLELRFYYMVSEKVLTEILLKFDASKIRSIYLVTPYSNTIDYNLLILKFQRICKIVCHSFDIDAVPEQYINNSRVQFTKDRINDNSGCGCVDLKLLNVNVKHFNESLFSNTCLSGKIAIDTDCNIKNCPSSIEILGNINTTSLFDSINNLHLKKLWGIKKDQIDVCKDCEYRYACTDCRVFIEDKENIFSKPLKCTYDPYKGIWN